MWWFAYAQFGLDGSRVWLLFGMTGRLASVGETQNQSKAAPTLFATWLKLCLKQGAW